MTVDSTSARFASVAWRRRAQGIAVAGAVLAALLVWLVAVLLLGQELVVTQPGRGSTEIGVGAVTVASLVPSLAGWGLLILLERLTARARVLWTSLAGLVLALSFLPVAQVEAEGAVKVTLALLHLVVGAVLIPVFWRTARP